MKSINKRLSELSIRYENNVLAENNRYQLLIEDENELDGMPEWVKNAAKEEATQAGHDGKWMFTLRSASFLPAMQYANRNIRNQLYVAYTNRCNHNDSTDNKGILKEIITLRLEKARLLGFSNYADFILDENMAQNSANVNPFLQQLWEHALPKAKEEAQELQAIMDESTPGQQLEAWDWWYYTEKLREKKYSLNEDELKPYFKLENVRDGVFAVAHKLYGITLSEIHNVPVYHPDVKVFEVKDADGRFLGLFYTDYFPRAGKQGGAWMSNYREQKEGRLLEISFVYRDTTLETLLRTFEAGQIRPEHLYQTLKFLPVNDGLKLSDRQVRDQQLFLPTDPEEMILAKSAFLRRMEEKKFLSGLEIDADGRASFVFKDNLTMNLFRKQGSIFELVVYNLLRESGMFDDIETGVKIAWDAEKNPADQVLLRLLNEPGSEAFGYRDYVSMRKKVLARRTERTVENEIDVIAVKDMNPVFLSCKTGANPEMGWLYEINSIAEHFQAAGVMVASSNFDQKARSMLRERAAQMKVPLWGTETLWDPDRLREALRHLIHGTIPGKQ